MCGALSDGQEGGLFFLTGCSATGVACVGKRTGDGGGGREGGGMTLQSSVTEWNAFVSHQH